MLGSAILRQPSNSLTFLTPTHMELDLEDRNIVKNYFARNKVDAVIHAAARVGGIQDNINFPYEYLNSNLRIDDSVLSAARSNNVSRLIYIGSTCMYPRNLDHPMNESDILTGELETTNEGYALAKIVGAKTVSIVAQEKGFAWRTLIPSNMYGPGDHFETGRSHLISAIILKVFEATNDDSNILKMWGDGSARREFTFVDDVAKFILDSLPKLDELPLLMNIGVGSDYSILEFYKTICQLMKFDGEIVPDLSKPEGMKSKLCDSSLARAYGWKPSTTIEQGLLQTIDYFQTEMSAK